MEKVKKKLGYRYAVAANDRAFGVHTNIRQRNERYHPFCVAIFSNYPIIRWEKVQSIKEYNHTFLWADVLVKGDTIRIFNIHLQSMHFAKKDYAFIENIDQQDMDDVQTAGRNIIRKMKTANLLRSAQARDIKDEMEKSPYPVIVCGDFNDTPMSYTYNQFNLFLKDAFRQSSSGFGSTYIGRLPAGRIDYLFYDANLRPSGFHIQSEELSDHRALVCTFSRVK